MKETSASGDDSWQSDKMGERMSRRDRFIGGSASLLAGLFFGWLALVWVRDQFGPGPEGRLFVLFFMALAVACLFRCFSSFRAFYHPTRKG